MQYQVLFVFILALFAIPYSLFPKISFAQIPPPYVPCDEVRPNLLHPLDKEFHSLRPYQASPCNKTVEETALFCGNDLLIKDQVSGFPPPPELPDRNCKPKGTDKEICWFDVAGSKSLNIDLSRAELPIMGNTESFTNSQNQDELKAPQDAAKMDEYVSWFLNGVIGRAEYPFLGKNSPRIVNYSGPLKKLLPWEIQTLSRIKSIENAKTLSHNQIVACKYSLISIFGVQIRPFIGPCYIPGLIGDLFTREEIRLNKWKKDDEMPPLPSDKENGKPKYENFTDWLIAYKEWRGEECIPLKIPEEIAGKKIPIIGGQTFFYCFDSLLNPNFYGDSFPYVPFSSLDEPSGITEDRKGEVEIDKYAVYPENEDVKIKNVNITNQTPAELFFPHMEEVNQMVDLLQSTYVAKDEAKKGEVINVAPGDNCDLVNIRTNKGDNLFATGISADVSYRAQFSCEFDIASPSACKKDVYINLSVISKTPKINEVWSRTVGGTASIFQRIFPKLSGENGIGSILDMPGATKVNYGGDVKAGNPASPREGESAELYFPHVGGIYEYFVKGIQTALRPKGYGEQIQFGPSDDAASYGNCKYTTGAIAIAMQKAADKYGIPVSLLKAIFEIEALEFIANPKDYVCEENFASAAGLTQTTKEAYRLVTCDSEKYDNDIGICKSEAGKLSRCDVEDTFELAARELMGKTGHWNYTPQCSPIGKFPADPLVIYKAACAYYGSCNPDNLTSQYSYNLPCPKRTNGEMNYCDIVWNKMHAGSCEPYPDQQKDCPYH